MIIFWMFFKNNGPNKTKTSRVTSSFYCIFSMSYTWLPIVPSLRIATLFPLRLNSDFKTIYPSIQNLAVSSSDDRPVFRGKALSRNNYLIQECMQILCIKTSVVCSCWVDPGVRYHLPPALIWASHKIWPDHANVMSFPHSMLTVNAKVSYVTFC